MVETEIYHSFLNLKVDGGNIMLQWMYVIIKGQIKSAVTGTH